MSEIYGFADLIRDELEMHKNTYDEGYNKGLNDAWELAKKLWHNTPRKNDDIYGIEYYIDITNEYTPQEALAKLEAYEKEQVFNVGDVVIGINDGVKGVVVKVKEDTIYILFRDGSAGEHKKRAVKKTGKHIDIQKILEQIGE